MADDIKNIVRRAGIEKPIVYGAFIGVVIAPRRLPSILGIDDESGLRPSAQIAILERAVVQQFSQRL